MIAAMARAPGLVRFAARYTRSIHDAEDAYQRAMEIALQRAPVVEEKEFMAWLHAVIRNEALTITRRTRREGPAAGDDVAATLAERAGDVLGPDAVAEWRERYRGLRAALSALTEAQRVCLMLKSAGASYAEIADITGFSGRKVERSIIEGRSALHGWELKMARGDECARILPALHRVAEAEATAREERAVSHHVKGCPSCRAVLSRRRESAQGLASLVPVGLVAGVMIPSRPPDPGHAFAWWERISAGATVRAGTAWQHALELPGMLGSKVGAGAAAAVVAGAAGGPFVADAVRSGHAAPVRTPPAAVRTVASVTPPAPVPTVRRRVAAPQRPAPRRRTARVVARHTAAHPARSVRVSLSRVTPPPAPAARVVTAPPPAPARAPRATALEFGP
ncbi:MAG: sigma-70 family RNA polymerase sigma factor [Actinomycetota bacterium]